MSEIEESNDSLSIHSDHSQANFCAYCRERKHECANAGCKIATIQHLEAGGAGHGAALRALMKFMTKADEVSRRSGVPHQISVVSNNFTTTVYEGGQPSIEELKRQVEELVARVNAAVDVQDAAKTEAGEYLRRFSNDILALMAGIPQAAKKHGEGMSDGAREVLKSATDNVAGVVAKAIAESAIKSS